jgi:phage terminase large subunit-like protein
VKKDESLSLGDMIQQMQDAVLQQARMPNMYAYRPHAKQLEFHSSQKKERLFVAGNRSGKTLGSVMEGIWYLTKTHPYRDTPKGQVRGRVVAVDFLNGVDKIILPLYKQLLPSEYLIEGSWNRSYSQERHVLTLRDGSFVEFMSQDQDLDKFAGTSRHFVHFDEECPEPIFEECKMRLLDTNGDWWISETPVAGMEWIYDNLYVPYFEQLARGEEPTIAVIEMATTENPFLDAEALERIFGTMSAEAREVRMSGQYTMISGSLYKEFGEFTHAAQSRADFHFDPARMRLYLCGDHGINNPTAWLWVAADHKGGLTVIREIYEKGKSVSEIARMIAEINAELGATPYLTVLDPATEQRTGFSDTEGRPMTIADEYRRHGVNVVTKGIPRDKQIGINKILQYLKTNPKTGRPFLTVLRDACPNTIREIKGAKQNRHVNKKVAALKNQPEGQREKDDHTTDALRYLMTFMNDLTPDDYAGTSPDKVEFIAEDLLAAKPSWMASRDRRQRQIETHGWHRAGQDSMFAGME